MSFSNITRASNFIYDAIVSNAHITIYGDYDVDGFNCMMCLKDMLLELGYRNFTCVNYTSRTHRINKDVVSTVVRNSSSLCIICDTGSSKEDKLTIDNLSTMTNVIIADHHRATINYLEFENNVIYVNPTVLDNYPYLSGACVVYEICMEYIKTFQSDKVNQFAKSLTFYAFSAMFADTVYSDNIYCRRLYEIAQMCYLPVHFNNMEYFNMSKRFCLFTYAPMINACMRNRDKLYILNKLYLENTSMLATDRFKLIKDLESVRDSTRPVIESLHSACTPEVIGEFVLVDLSGLLNQDIPNSLIWDNKGLLASRLAGEYKKCCVCIVSRGSNYVLSVRDYCNRDVYRLFNTQFNVGGHLSAFGGELQPMQIVNLKLKLLQLSKYMESATKLKVVDYEDVSFTDISRISAENEFRSPSDIVAIRIPLYQMTRQWTPESFSERYEQYVFAPTPQNKIYIKRENISPNHKYAYVHFFKYTRLKGEIVGGE